MTGAPEILTVGMAFVILQSGFHTGTWESFLRSIKNVSKLTKLRRQRDKQLQLPSFKPPKQ